MRWSGPESVVAAIVFAAIGAGYGTRVRLGETVVAVAGGFGFTVGFIPGWVWLLVPLRLRCLPRAASWPRRRCRTPSGG